MRQVAIITFVCFLGLGVLQPRSGESCALVVTSLEYPHMARYARISGTVELKVRVRADGSVESTEVTNVKTNARREDANTLLIQASQENVQKWRFAAADGSGPLREVGIRYVYRLEGEESGGPRTRIEFSLPLTVEVIGQPPPGIID